MAFVNIWIREILKKELVEAFVPITNDSDNHLFLTHLTPWAISAFRKSENIQNRTHRTSKPEILDPGQKMKFDLRNCNGHSTLCICHPGLSPLVAMYVAIFSICISLKLYNVCAQVHLAVPLIRNYLMYAPLSLSAFNRFNIQRKRKSFSHNQYRSAYCYTCAITSQNIKIIPMFNRSVFLLLSIASLACSLCSGSPCDCHLLIQTHLLSLGDFANFALWQFYQINDMTSFAPSHRIVDWINFFTSSFLRTRAVQTVEELHGVLRVHLLRCDNCVRRPPFMDRSRDCFINFVEKKKSRRCVNLGLSKWCSPPRCFYFHNSHFNSNTHLCGRCAAVTFGRCNPTNTNCGNTLLISLPLHLHADHRSPNHLFEF